MGEITYEASYINFDSTQSHKTRTLVKFHFLYRIFTPNLKFNVLKEEV